MTVRSRYSESRTLVRRLCRLPGEDQASFKSKTVRLREHFERFSLDVSELCQWLVGLRPGRAGAEAHAADLWRFMLEPSVEGVEADEGERECERPQDRGFRHRTGLGTARLGCQRGVSRWHGGRMRPAV